MFVFLRAFVGILFLVTGTAKLLSPHQNFLYVIQAYQALPSPIETAVSYVFPWIEFLAGLFLLLGLQTAWALRVAIVLFASFIIIVAQALYRHLQIDSCGCFGEWLHLPLSAIIVFDSFCLLLCIVQLKFLRQTQRLSLDVHFDQ